MIALVCTGLIAGSGKPPSQRPGYPFGGSFGRTQPNAVHGTGCAGVRG